MRGVTLAICVVAGGASASVIAQSTTDAVHRCHTFALPESGNPDGAIAACTAVIESDRFTLAQRLDALAARGVFFRKTGRFDLAVVDFTEVLRTRIAADGVYVERGMALAAMREPELAMADFHEAIRLNPKNTAAFSQRAVAYRQKGWYDEANSRSRSCRCAQPAGSVGGQRAWPRSLLERRIRSRDP